MRKIYLLFILLLPFILLGQVSLKNIRQKSYQLLAFKVSALDVEKYLKQDSIPIDKFLNQIPSHTFHHDSVETDLLPNGHYILISINGSDVEANMIGVSDLIVYPVNNRYNIELDIRTQGGVFVADAKVWVNNKEAKYNASAKTYELRQKKVISGLVKVFTLNDTTFINLEAEDNYTVPIWKQRWKNFKVTTTGRVINYLPKGIISLLKKQRRHKPNNTRAAGYILFNQPKYKLTDTVKLKAYIVDSKWKRYQKKANVFLEYRAKEKWIDQLLTTLAPVSPGSFVYSFPLHDTLPSDTRYSIIFKTMDGKRIISKPFSTEDYLLDEIGSYQFHTKSDSYYLNDTMQFYAIAKDANGLSLLDGNATLILTTNSINEFYKDSIRVADTLFIKEKPLVTEGETTFSFATNELPEGQLSIKASMIFKNSNNELHEETENVIYSPASKKLVVTSHADSVFATYIVNGKPVQAEGIVNASGVDIDRSSKVSFPVKLKVDPLADEYEFNLIKGRDTLAEKIDIERNYSITLSRVSRQDTLGFILNNPYKIPVTYKVHNGNAIVYSGKDDRQNITWEMVTKNKRKMYTVIWQYTWTGEQIERRENIALLYKLLQVKVNNEGTVFPGQRDTVTIEVKDYKNRPAEGVNLAAVAYNSQFKNDIEVREPPYLVKYKHKPLITRDRHETDDPYIIKSYKLGDHQGWIKRMGVDTMQFYKILFPKSYPYDIVTPMSDFIPQLSIHVVKKGQPQEIYLLYVNRQLVYFNGVTDKMKYAFQTIQGYTQIGLRLFDKYIQVDSLYIQPFYKHDIVIDLDSLPAFSTVTETPNYWTAQERSIIENSIWQLDNASRTNDGFIWQYNRVAKLGGHSRHLVGPFNRLDSLHYYAQGDFDLHFIFEPGYEYNLSKQISRLEKQTIFPANKPKIMLAKVSSSSFNLGDTMVTPPSINYGFASNAFIKTSTFLTYNPYNQKSGTGKLQFILAKDTLLKYVVLYNKDTSFTNIVLDEHTHIIKNIRPGRYSLLLVNKQFETAEIRDLQINSDQTLCFNASSYAYEKDNALIQEMIEKSMAKPPVAVKTGNIKIEVRKTSAPIPEYPVGSISIQGKVIDAKGKKGIPYATIMIQGTTKTISANSEGSFVIYNLKEGKYTLLILSVGYVEKETSIIVKSGEPVNVDIRLNISEQALMEVVVTGYGTSRKLMTGSITNILGQELSAGFLQGKAPGVSISGEPGLGQHINIRGIASVSGDNQPIYVVDGIVYNEMPPNIKPDMIQSVEVLKDAAATAIYGARGANGVVIITTGSKALRNKFSDNAIWQPELFTNSEGKVSFEVVYPDNITGWELYVLAMDKKRRMGKGISFTKAYKPLMAQINTPQFLIINDSVQFIGKALNHTSDNYSIQTKLSLNGNLLYSKDTFLAGNQSYVSPLSITTASTDTLNASFTLRTTTGFNDGEEKRIPVLKKGSEEVNGLFAILQKDTTFNFMPVPNSEPVEVYAHNNTLDILLIELDRLKKYPYYCMEQIASKLKGLLMEQQIREMMKQPFTNGKDIIILKKKLQDNQLFDGGWSWWEKGKGDLNITAYIIEALIALRKDPLVETNIRNGLLFLQNQLPYAKRDELLQILSCMSMANHAIDYKTYLDKLNYDSLTQHQQWQWVNISQQQKLDYSKQLQQLITKQTKTITGGVHWGTENYHWYSNTIATTVLAYSVLEKEKTYQHLLPHIIQYFLEQRRIGFWRNTVESASITSAILPYILETNKNFSSPAAIGINGDTSLTIKSFPYSTRLTAKSTRPIVINKTGGGITYLTLYQNSWNEHPEAVTDKFDITTYFEKNGSKVLDIPAGEKVKMMVKINVLKDADYVLIEIPIPAGCNYANKRQDSWMHKEFYKNKVALFSESLLKGMHEFEIELEARYKGSFTINPAKAELMYFPVLFGRNKMSKVKIR
ncbi:MAG: carboxypeptidase-like regulatory domain-containing protein [Ginsengibacter sp.]